MDLNIEDIVKEMNYLEDDTVNANNWDGEKWKRLNTEFWSALHHKESLLVRKARVNWIQQGDNNTRFFHNTVKYRQKRNHIDLLKAGIGG